MLQKLALSSIILLISIIAVDAQTRTVVNDGNWNNSANWQGGSIADILSEDVEFQNNRLLTILNGETFDVGNITFANTNSITINSGGRLNVGDISNSRDLTAGNAANLTVEGDLYIYGDLIVQNDLSVTITGTMVVLGNVELFNNAELLVTGSLQVDGNFTGGTNTDVTVIAGGTVNVDGNLNVGNNSRKLGSGDFTVGGTCSDGSGSSFCVNVLPIELLFFNASSQNSIVSLAWATASEENFDFFTIERSSDGIDYEEVAKVAGNGWSDDVINYSYQDTKPLSGNSYYRLKATDLDDTYEYFSPRLVKIDIRSNLLLNSNPVSREPLKFRLSGAHEGNILINIINSEGRIIYQRTISRKQSEYDVEKSLDKGIYLLRVETTEQVYTTRFVQL